VGDLVCFRGLGAGAGRAAPDYDLQPAGGVDLMHDSSDSGGGGSDCEAIEGGRELALD
jgi:hypothetical protein